MRASFVAAMAACVIFAATCEPRSSHSETNGAQNKISGSLARSPRVILWAWQQPENLSFIDPRRVGVSFLVETIRLEEGRVVTIPNPNPLKVPAGVWLMACVRIEAGNPGPRGLSSHQADEAAARLRSLAGLRGVKALQIDFDATASERNFYRELLVRLRSKLPSGFPLSITALASWCMDDDWIRGLPVNEAVPMLFRMGPDRGSILLRLQQGGDFTEPLCRTSAGISTDEFVPRLPPDRRLYIFDPNGWTRAAFNAIMARSKR